MGNPADLTSGKIVVASPHLDDAALSLGGTISRATRSGAEVVVLTVLAGDPKSAAPPGEWDRKCGFSSVGDAVRERRNEDARACEILGARPVWLPFFDAEYQRGGTDDEVWAEIARELTGADLVLTPGYPLEHPDHVWLTRLLADRLPAGLSLWLYVEQPYANLMVIGRGYVSSAMAKAAHVAFRSAKGKRLLQPRTPESICDVISEGVAWISAPTVRRDWQMKHAALLCYRTQLEPLGGRMLLHRIRLYEWGWGGEGLGKPLSVKLQGSELRPADEAPEARRVGD